MWDPFKMCITYTNRYQENYSNNCQKQAFAYKIWFMKDLSKVLIETYMYLVIQDLHLKNTHVLCSVRSASRKAVRKKIQISWPRLLSEINIHVVSCHLIHFYLRNIPSQHFWDATSKTVEDNDREEGNIEHKRRPFIPLGPPSQHGLTIYTYLK